MTFHVVACSGGTAPPLTRGLGFEPMEKILLGAYLRMSPAVHHLNLVWAPMQAADTKWKQKKREYQNSLSFRDI